MLQTSMRIAALVALSLLILVPDAVARGGGGHSSGGHGGFSGGRSFSGGHSFSAGRSFSGARSYSAPRSYSRSYSAPRSYSSSRSYSGSRSYSATRSYSRSASPSRSYATPRQHATPQHVARPNISTPRSVASHPVAQARANVARSNVAGAQARHLAGAQRNWSVNSHAGRNGFHLANAATRTLGAHALHNKFVAGRLSGAGIHGRAFAQAATFHGHFTHRNWHRHHFPRFIVLGWAGPLFWPYAYDDFVDYTFYPYAYDTFWPYAYDDVYDGIFGRYALGNAPVRVTGGEPAPGPGVVATTVRTRTDICKGETAASLTDWPIEQIAQAVEPTEAQRAALQDLRIATGKALDVLKTACPNDLPSTPTGRIAAMQKRLGVMLLAVRTVRPALEAFYQTLSDEQKARFNAISPEEAAQPNERDLTQVCSERASGVTSLPIDRIEQTVRPNEVQRVALNGLRDAMAASVNLLKSDCPTYRALTPVGRVEAMEQRLDAMLRAVQTLQPALDGFYGTLSDEQKERFNRLGPAQS